MAVRYTGCMDAKQYNQMSQPLRERPELLRALTLANKGLTTLGYVVYPLLLVILFATQDPFLMRCFVVPLVGFVTLSLARAAINAPRPYEALDIQPLIKKDTHGKSFPSRHAFSMFMIAFCWLQWCVPVGVLLLIAGVEMSAVRVMGGVHFPRDVAAGFLFALACAAVGFWLIP